MTIMTLRKMLTPRIKLRLPNTLKITIIRRPLACKKFHVDSIVIAKNPPVIAHADEVVAVLKRIIKRYGLCVPPRVHPLENGTFEISQGQFLLQAWKEIGLGATILCEIEGGDENEDSNKSRE